MSPANALNQPKSTRRISLLLVSLMLTSVMVSLVPTVLASHEKTYHTTRNPTTIAAGDLDCDGDDDDHDDDADDNDDVVINSTGRLLQYAGAGPGQNF